MTRELNNRLLDTNKKCVLHPGLETAAHCSQVPGFVSFVQPEKTCSPRNPNMSLIVSQQGEDLVLTARTGSRSWYLLAASLEMLQGVWHGRRAHIPQSPVARLING